MTKLPKRSQPSRRLAKYRRRSKNTGRDRTSWSKRFFSAVLVLAIIVAMVFGVVLTVGPSIFPLHTSQNILFIPFSLDGETNEMYFASFSVDDQTIKVTPVQDTTTTVIGGYGQYRLSAIWSLLQLEKKPAQFIQAALSWSTQVVVDDVISTDQTSSFTISNKQQLMQVMARELRGRWYRPDQFISLLSLFFFTKTVPEEQVMVLTQSVAISALPEYIGQHQAVCPIAVINTTSKSGLATVTAKIFEQSRLSVLRVTDDPTNLPESIISVTAEKKHPCYRLAKRLRTIFPNSVKLVDQPQLRQEHRADMVIVLGGDLAEVVAW